ncbi:hypothetical protein Tco_0913813, partial [Tanacetum coccineum]
LQDTSIVEAKLSGRGSALVAGIYQPWSSESSCQCTSSDGDNAPPIVREREGERGEDGEGGRGRRREREREGKGERERERDLFMLHQSLACISLGLRSQGFLHTSSIDCGPNVCDIRTSLLLLTSCADCCSYLVSRLLLLTSCVDCCSLPPEQTAALYLLCRHYSLVIASGPEMTFVILARGVIGSGCWVIGLNVSG